MAHYEDLSPCDYFGGILRARPLLAVGWLESGYPYATGDPGPEVGSRLNEFLWPLAWQPGLTFGSHLCRLGSCRYGSFCYGMMSIVEARGRALVAAVEVFRRIRGRWPQGLGEAVELVDDAGAWHYAREEHEFTLETDRRALEACALRYESRLGVWKVAMGPRWF